MPGPLRQPAEGVHGSGEQHPAAADRHRALGLGEDSGGALHLVARRRAGDVGEPGIRPDLVGRNRCLLDIEGKRQVNGARAPAHGLAKRPPHASRQGGAFIEDRIPLGDGPEKRLLIEFRERETAA